MDKGLSGSGATTPLAASRKRENRVRRIERALHMISRGPGLSALVKGCGIILSCFFIIMSSTLLSGCSTQEQGVPKDTAVTTDTTLPMDTAVKADTDVPTDTDVEYTRTTEAGSLRPVDPEAGKIVFEKYCHYCHGREGRGDGPIGIAVSPHPADFVGDRKRMVKSDEELFESIKQGIHKEIGGDAMYMPSWKDKLSDQEMWDVLAYIRLLEKKGLESEK